MIAARRILVSQTGFLGDTVLSTPVITNLKRLYPEAKITVLTTPAALEMIAAHPDVDEVIGFDKRGKQSGLQGVIELAESLRQRDFDLALSLHKSWRSSAVIRLSKIPLRIGFKEAAGSFLYTHTVKRSHYTHEVYRNLAILEPLGVNIMKVSSSLSLGIPPQFSENARDKLASLNGHHGVVGLAPGSVWATKQWTPSGFAAVGEQMRERGYGVVILGGPGDMDAAKRVESLMAAPVLNLAGSLSLLQSAAVIKELSLLVCNDSAPLHISSAVGTPVVSAFCATVPEFGFGPWKVPSEVVGVRGLTCRPCGRHGSMDCPTGTHACQLELKPRYVVEAIDRVLAAAARLGARSGNQGV